MTPAGFKGGDEVVVEALCLLKDGLLVLLKGKFSMPNVKEDWLGALKLKNSFLGGFIDACPESFCSLVDALDMIACLRI